MTRTRLVAAVKNDHPDVPYILLKYRKRLVALLDEWVKAERTAAGCPSTWSPTLVGIMEDDAAALKQKILDILS